MRTIRSISLGDRMLMWTMTQRLPNDLAVPEHEVGGPLRAQGRSYRGTNGGL